MAATIRVLAGDYPLTVQTLDQGGAVVANLTDNVYPQQEQDFVLAGPQRLRITERTELGVDFRDPIPPLSA